MTPAQRRDMIISTAIPLIAEYGAAVTTGKIARAAGIGEATVFRVFADKEELLDACMAEAMRPDHTVRELNSISLDQPLADRLAEAADALRAYLARMGAVAGSLHASGHRRRERGGKTAEPRPGDREDSLAKIRTAVAELLEPDKESLRHPAEQTAAVFLGLLFMQPRGGDDQPQLTAQELAQLFLYGAVEARETRKEPGESPGMTGSASRKPAGR